MEIVYVKETSLGSVFGEESFVLKLDLENIFVSQGIIFHIWKV